MSEVDRRSPGRIEEKAAVAGDLAVQIIVSRELRAPLELSKSGTEPDIRGGGNHLVTAPEPNSREAYHYSQS